TQIQALVAQYYPDDTIEVQTMQANFQESHAELKSLAQLLAYASAISLLLAAFGIYVLAATSVQKRGREIILRKLYGANAYAIARLVVREFALLIGIAALLALPLAYLSIQNYLADFIERAPIGVWTILAAFIVSSVVAGLATLRHTLSAMRMMPVQVLRE
ncbi:MAG: hypothetical protein K2Q15_06115, partial [Burkholderiales bacterium]|nr:hypothetical protein [Burkholderiales bacterium]